jgi:glutaredoxin-related protein
VSTTLCTSETLGCQTLVYHTNPRLIHKHVVHESAKTLSAFMTLGWQNPGFDGLAKPYVLQKTCIYSVLSLFYVYKTLCPTKPYELAATLCYTNPMYIKNLVSTNPMLMHMQKTLSFPQCFKAFKHVDIFLHCKFSCWQKVLSHPPVSQTTWTCHYILQSPDTIPGSLIKTCDVAMA